MVISLRLSDQNFTATSPSTDARVDKEVRINSNRTRFKEQCFEM